MDEEQEQKTRRSGRSRTTNPHRNLVKRNPVSTGHFRSVHSNLGTSLARSRRKRSFTNLGIIQQAELGDFRDL